MTNRIPIEYVEALIKAYQTAHDMNRMPATGMRLTVDGKEMVLVLMHPDAWKRFSALYPVDPRSGWDGR